MTEIEKLRAEVAEMRKLVAELSADRAVHHYHHQAAPTYPHWPTYYPATCGGQALPAVGLSSVNHPITLT